VPNASLRGTARARWRRRLARLVREHGLLAVETLRRTWLSEHAEWEERERAA
jgi:hypothetical protein